MGPIVCPEMSVKNYHYTLRSSPEERSSHLLRGGTLKSLKLWKYMLYTHYFFSERFIAKKVCRACSWTSYKIVPVTSFNKYLYNGKSKIKMNICDSSEKFLKKKKHCD